MKEPYLIHFDKIGSEEEGYITIASSKDKVPFEIKRSFWTHQTPENVQRGNHAHFQTEMILIALNGVIKVDCLIYPNYQKQFILSNPQTGLYIPIFCWHTMQYEQNAIQMVLTNTFYQPMDYIRNFDEYKSILKQKNNISLTK